AIGALVCSITDGGPLAAEGAPRAARWYSRHALPASCALTLTTLGNSSVYAFLPLYALAHGMRGGIGWFYALFSTWLIVCRLLFRGVSDQVGRGRVVTPAMTAIALAYLALAIPPTAYTLTAAALLLASGGALLYPTLVALLVDRTPETERGLA